MCRWTRPGQRHPSAKTSRSVWQRYLRRGFRRRQAPKDPGYGHSANQIQYDAMDVATAYLHRKLRPELVIAGALPGPEKIGAGDDVVRLETAGRGVHQYAICADFVGATTQFEGHWGSKFHIRYSP